MKNLVTVIFWTYENITVEFQQQLQQSVNILALYAWQFGTRCLIHCAIQLLSLNVAGGLENAYFCQTLET